MPVLPPLNLNDPAQQDTAMSYLTAATGALLRAARAVGGGEAGKEALLDEIGACRLVLAMLYRRCTEPLPFAMGEGEPDDEEENGDKSNGRDEE